MRKQALLSVFLLTVLPAMPGFGQEDYHPSLVVTGDSTMQAPPDRAVIRLGVVRQGTTAQEAQREANSAAQSVLDSVRGMVPDSKNLQTSQLTISPVYSDSRPDPIRRTTEPKIVGYRASNIVSVTMDDLQKVGPMVDAALKAGSNQVENIQFQLKDDAPLREKALTAAADEARRKAQVIAAALGVEIIGIQEVSESRVTVQPVGFRAELMAAQVADVSTPVEPGMISVRAGLTIRYRISAK